MSDPPTAARRRLQPRERTMLIVLGAVGVLAVGFLLLNVLGGGKEEDTTTAPTRAPRARASATPTPTETPPPETDEAFEGRDPFQPLVVPAGPEGEESPPPGDTSEPVGDEDGETRRVRLLDVFEDDGDLLATVEVGGDQFTVAEGETFAESFRLLDLTEECGQFVFGDERFTLCIGQEVRK